MKPYTFHISLYVIVSLGTLFIGIILALLLGFAKRVDRTANLFLGLALAVIILNTGGLMPLLLPALGPLIYFYVRQLTSTEQQFRRKDMLHFCSLLAGYWMPAWLILISVIIYLYLSHRLIEDFYRRLRPVLMDRPRFAFRRLERALFLLGLFCLLWLLNDDFSFAASFVLIGMAVEVMLKTDTGVQLAVPITDRSDARDKGRRLKEAVAANRLYGDAELTLPTLAVKLGIHPHELSRIINVGLEKNFSDFINEFRVREVARKMLDPACDRLTLLGIAYESGFNSERTFHRVFKEMSGKTPLEYKNSLRKELPIDKLALQLRTRSVILRSESLQTWAPVKLKRNYMFRNYLKMAWRNLIRNKGYATINIVGLSVGIAASLLIFLVIQYETSFDNFHNNKDHIYRIVTESKTPAGKNYIAGVPLPTAEALRIDYPQMLIASIFKTDKQLTVQSNSTQRPKNFDEDGLYFAEPQFFSVFNFEWLSGDSKTALAEPNTAVLTQNAAEKYFGNWRDAIGKTIKYENNNNLKVTGVLKNMPANTDLNLSVVVSFSTLKSTNFKNAMTDQGGNFASHYCFMVLPNGMTAGRFNNNLTAFAKKHKPVDHINDAMILQPLNEMHYDSRFGTFSGKTFSKELIKALSLIGLFLLIIACVNFINMATAQAVNRSKEVGVRKVLGSNRSQLMVQFISETFIITLFAVVLAIGLAEIALPFLNQLLVIKLGTAFFVDFTLIIFLGAVIFGVTLLSGFYPALVLSGFNPITALKNKISAASSKGISLRRGLVILQFCIAQVLVIGTLVIISQMDYFKNHSLGFDKDAVVNVSVPGDSISRSRFEGLRNQLLQQPGIKNVSYSFASPSDNYFMDNYFKYDNSTKKTDFLTQFKWADAEYFKLYNIKFIAGGPYEKSDAVRGYVVNETLLKKLGVRDPKDAIGKYINIWDDKTKFAPIVGVVKDFNVSSLKEKIPPVLMASSKDFFATLNIKLQSADVQQTMTSIEKIWTTTFPNDVYEYQFLDTKIAAFYSQEDQLSALFKTFAGIAIFISCLGLYGMVSFMTIQRTKEVGIRKTLGASVSHIVYLFSKEFTLLILIAFAISVPFGWYFMNKWLQSFVYKISLGPGIFILAIASSVIIAWLTVGYKAVKAATANPVKSLRSE